MGNDQIFTIRPALFWDVDLQHLDLQEHKTSIIERVTLRGRWEEFHALVKFYGKPVVLEALLQARWLDKRTLAFCCNFFNTQITEFRCFKIAQSNPEHWNY
jgi:hypothetical protein